MAITDVDPDLVRETANNTFVGMGELETHLRTMSSAQDELYVAVKGQTGDAIYKALADAYEKGTKLAKDLQGIVDVMQKNHVSFNEGDMDAAAKVYAQMGGDGSIGANDGFVSDSAARSAADRLNLNI
ncbi:hypothetical protein [Nocardia wallacei]|uniref:Uncharacterized protein n=1 Tax=Nocardia wallacei TaxID=480035 RepID=A0A7G1KST7_9NOCA|nr:hypothetical protein [Nocardia wallacei]BCK57273.1 hypothetical protein NWFMUON74_50450 [Nocardia wallacei]